MSAEVDAPRSVGGVINRTLRTYRSYLRPSLPIYLLLALIAVMAYIAIAVQQGRLIMAAIGHFITAMATPWVDGWFGAGAYTLYVVDPNSCRECRDLALKSPD